MILVGTKLDLRDDPDTLAKLKSKGGWAISTEQGHQLAKRIKALKYMEASAKTGQQLKPIFDEAVKGVFFISLVSQRGEGRDWMCVCVCVCVCCL